MQNPYAKPAAPVAPVVAGDDGIDPDAATFQPAIFAMHGRVGRVRYFAYSFVQQLVVMTLLAVLAAIAMPAAGAGSSGQLLLLGGFYLVAVIGSFIMVKRRLNDLDHSGWLSLLLLVPLLNAFLLLYVMLWPGTPGHNNYGPKPVPNTLALVLFALLPFLVCIVAGVAVYAYMTSLPAGGIPGFPPAP